MTALDALRLVDLGLPVVERDGAAGAVIGTVLGQTALTGVRHLKMSRRTAVAGILDDVDQRRIVVFLRDRTLLHSVGEQVVLRNVAQGQAHSQTDPFANDGALQEDRLPELPNLSGHDLIGQLLHPAVVIPILIGKSCHLGKDPLANVGYAALDVAHEFFPPDCQKIYSKIYTVNILTNKYAESNHSLRKNYHFYEKLSLCDGLFSSPPESPGKCPPSLPFRRKNFA